MTRFAFSALLTFALACGDDDAPSDDPTPDASITDGGATDESDGGDRDGGSSDPDAATDPDGGTGDVDAAMADAGPEPDLGAAPCEGLLFGSPCRESCSRGYECVDGACLPSSSRPHCGGFAGATCTTRAFPNCVFFSGSDYGPCLSEDELTCACSALADRFSCTDR